MRKLNYFILVLIMLVSFNVHAKPANTAFKDDNFYKCVIDMYNSEQHKNVSYDTNLSNEELAKIKYLSCRNKGISDTSGIELLTSLINIKLDDNNITSFTIPKGSLVYYIDINNNKLVTLDIRNATKLTHISASNNKLKTLDVSKNPLLDYIYLSHNEISSFDVTKNPELATLDLGVLYSYSGDKITTIDLTKNTKLKSLNLDYHNISSIDLTKNTELTYLRIINNKLSSINLTKNTKLVQLSLATNKLTSIDLSKNSLITELSLSNNELETVNLTKMVDLRNLNLNSNNLKTLDLTNNTKVTSAYLGANKLTSLNLNNNINLYALSVYGNDLTELDLSNNNSLSSLEAERNKIKTIKLGDVSKINTLKLLYNPITSFTYTSLFSKLTILTSNPFVLKKIDFSKTSLLTKLEVSNIRNKSDLNISMPTIKDLTLYDVNVDTLDLSKLPNLENLIFDIYNYDVIVTDEVILSNNTKLAKIEYSHNYVEDTKFAIGKLDISKNSNLETLDIYGDVNIIFGSSDKLTKAHIAKTNMERIVLSGYPNLKNISIYDNDNLKGIDLRNVNASEYMFISTHDTKTDYLYTNKNTRSLNFSDFDLWFGPIDIVVGLKTTKKEFNQMFKSIENKSIMNKQGVLIGDDDYIKTGDILYKNPYRYRNVIVVKGDVTGSGTSTVSDVAKLYQYLKGKIEMNKEYVIAGNVVDTDNVIKINDVAKLYQYIKGKISSIF